MQLLGSFKNFKNCGSFIKEQLLIADFIGIKIVKILDIFDYILLENYFLLIA